MAYISARAAAFRLLLSTRQKYIFRKNQMQRELSLQCLYRSLFYGNEYSSAYKFMKIILFIFTLFRLRRYILSMSYAYIHIILCGNGWSTFFLYALSELIV